MRTTCVLFAVLLLCLVTRSIAEGVEDPVAARLLQEAQTTLGELEAAYGRFDSQAWDQFVQAGATLGYQYDGLDVTPVDEPDTFATGSRPLSIPLQVRGQMIGALDVWSHEQELSEDEAAFLNSLEWDRDLKDQNVIVEKTADYSSGRGVDEGSVVYRITLRNPAGSLTLYLKGFGKGMKGAGMAGESRRDFTSLFIINWPDFWA